MKKTKTKTKNTKKGRKENPVPMPVFRRGKIVLEGDQSAFHVTEKNDCVSQGHGAERVSATNLIHWRKNKKSESRRSLTIEKVFRSRGLEGTYSMKEITAYVESLKRVYTVAQKGSNPVHDPFHCAANDLRNTLLDEVIYEFWNSDIPF